MLMDLMYLNQNQNSPINKIILLTHYLQRLMFSTSTCDRPYTDNLAYLLPPHTSDYFVELMEHDSTTFGMQIRRSAN